MKEKELQSWCTVLDKNKDLGEDLGTARTFYLSQSIFSIRHLTLSALGLPIQVCKKCSFFFFFLTLLTVCPPFALGLNLSEQLGKYCCNTFHLPTAPQAAFQGFPNWLLPDKLSKLKKCKENMAFAQARARLKRFYYIACSTRFRVRQSEGVRHVEQVLFTPRIIIIKITALIWVHESSVWPEITLRELKVRTQKQLQQYYCLKVCSMCSFYAWGRRRDNSGGNESESERTVNEEKQTKSILQRSDIALITWRAALERTTNWVITFSDGLRKKEKENHRIIKLGKLNVNSA